MNFFRVLKFKMSTEPITFLMLLTKLSVLLLIPEAIEVAPEVKEEEEEAAEVAPEEVEEETPEEDLVEEEIKR